VSNGSGCLDTSPTAVLTVNAAPVVSAISPTAPSICPVESATFSLTATGVTGHNWYRVGSSTAVGTVATYTTSTAGSYYCIVSNGSGCLDTSPTATLTVNALPSVSISGASQPVCVGSNVTLSVTTGTGWTYQWSMGGTQLSTVSSLTLSNIQTSNGGTYTCVVTDGNGCSSTATATLTVVSKPSAGTVSPLSNSVCTGADVTFTVDVTGSNLTYQWYKNTTTLVGQTTTNQYTISNVDINSEGSYSCKITNGAGCTSNMSSASTLFIKQLSISAEPEDVALHSVDIPAAFRVYVSGSSGYTYEWWTLVYRDQNWEKCIDNAYYSGSSTWELNYIFAGPRYFYCRITDNCGVTVQSRIAQLTYVP
jgi:hypothetical protein